VAFVAPCTPRPSRVDPDSNTRIAIARPVTILPPAAPYASSPESSCDDDMTVLWMPRPAPSRAVAPTRRSSAPPPAAVSFSNSLENEMRLACSGSPGVWPRPPAPVEEPASERRAPDSLRPVAMAAMAAVDGADQSGRHDLPPPTSITMRTHVLTGRPTLTWAAALVVIGVFVGFGTSLFAAGEAGRTAGAAAWTGTERVAAAGQPATVSFTAEGAAPRSVSFSSDVPAKPATAPALTAEALQPAKIAAAAPVVPAATATSTAWAPVTTPDHAQPQDPDPIVAIEAKHEAAPRSASRPTYSAPPRHAAPRPTPAVVAAAPPPAPKPAAAPAHSKKGTDADLQAASASDALARAQLEAALR
jgi:hypothetical protein